MLIRLTLDCNPQLCLLLCPIQTQTSCQQGDGSSFSFLFHQGTAPVKCCLSIKCKLKVILSHALGVIKRAQSGNSSL